MARRAAELIDALRAGARPVDEGTFSLDIDAAARKLAEHRYVDRSLYLPAMVEGLRALRSDAQTIETPAADVVVEAVGPLALPADELVARLFEHAMLGRPKDRVGFGLARLATGISMAMGIDGVEQVVVEASDVDHATVMTFRAGETTVLESPDPALPRGAPGVRIYVDRARWRDLTSPLMNHAREELDALRRGALHAPPGTVRIDGDAWRSQGIPDMAVPRRASADGVRVVLGYDLGDDAGNALIRFRSYGVVIEAVERPDWDPGMRAFVNLHRARRDVGEARVLRDEQFDDAVDAMERARSRALRRLRKHLRRYKKDDRRYPEDARRRGMRLVRGAGRRLKW